MLADSGLCCNAPHLVLVPFKDNGHIVPMMVLAKRLQKAGLFITMVILEPETHQYVKKIWDADPEFKSNPVQLILVEQTEDESRKSEGLETTLESLKGSNNPPRGVLVDIILKWDMEAIDRSKIPKYVIYTASCANLSVMFGVKPSFQSEEEKMASQRQILDPRMRGHKFKPHHDDWKKDLWDAEAVLVNTAYEFEGREVDFLQEQTKKLVLPVGPLLPPPEDDAKSTGGDFSAGWQWLDQQAESSVVFISFGSRTYLQKEQIVELANGLERSKQPYLWLLPVPPFSESRDAEEYLDSVLPEGFRSRKQAGIIICDWAPQKLILKHRSLGVFLTHCGWNSVLECLSLAAKPMLCWPFRGDQPANARLLVDELRVGLEAKKDESGTVRSSEIESKILMLVDKRKEMEAKLAELQQIINRAGQGSSMNNVHKFVKLIATK